MRRLSQSLALALGVVVCVGASVNVRAAAPMGVFETARQLLRSIDVDFGRAVLARPVMQRVARGIRYLEAAVRRSGPVDSPSIAITVEGAVFHNRGHGALTPAATDRPRSWRRRCGSCTVIPLTRPGPASCSQFIRMSRPVEEELHGSAESPSEREPPRAGRRHGRSGRGVLVLDGRDRALRAPAVRRRARPRSTLGRVTEMARSSVFYDHQGPAGVHDLQGAAPRGAARSDVAAPEEGAFSPSKISASTTTSGVDVIRIAGAAVANLRERRAAQGGSTITQQLARMSFLTPDKTYTRKLQEVAPRRADRERVLEGSDPRALSEQGVFRRRLYGAEAASLGYFGKHAADLTVAEAAMLAGLVKAPSNYAPTVNLERAVQAPQPSCCRRCTTTRRRSIEATFERARSDARSC